MEAVERGIPLSFATFIQNEVIQWHARNIVRRALTKEEMIEET